VIYLVEQGRAVALDEVTVKGRYRVAG